MDVQSEQKEVSLLRFWRDVFCTSDYVTVYRSILLIDKHREKVQLHFARSLLPLICFVGQVKEVLIYVY